VRGTSCAFLSADQFNVRQYSVATTLSPDIAALLEAEYGASTHIPLREALAPYICHPYERVLRWPWSSQKPDAACWIVADLASKKEGVTLAFCERGHGERGDHWGIVLKSDTVIGRDDSWFLRLEDAFINAGVWSEPLPKEYEIR
jgi:hypothetical protein